MSIEIYLLFSINFSSLIISSTLERSAGTILHFIFE